MQDNEKKPALRFKGFTDPWEQRKLGEIAVFSKGVGYSKNDLCEEGTPIILYGRLYTKYETCIFDVDTFVKEKAGSVYSKGGEVIVPASGETAEDISIASVVVKPGILLGGDLNIVSPTAEYDSAFLALTISSGATHKYLSSLAQGKSVVHLHNSDIQSVSAKFPTKREQEKIHLIFGKIDTLITLHQRKYEKLVNIKKSMLDKMFPQNGASVPEIRFKGFTDPWEQRKFSDITFPAGEKNRDNLPLESYSITNEHGFIPQDEKFENGGTMREADKRMYYIVSPNSFAYNPARINVGSIGYQNTGKDVIVSSLYEVFKTSDDVDDRLLWHWFKSPDFQKLIFQLQEGGVRLYFYYDKLCMGTVSLPSLEEQRKIGQFFDSLDTLITLHQRKYEKLVNIKKSMLDKMFPQNGASVPEIRFKSFTDPWEQRKLGDISEIKTGPFGSTLHADDYVSDGIPIITTEHFKTGSLPIDKCGLPQVSENDFSRLSAYILNAGDIVFSRVGSVDINALITPFQSTWLFSGRVLRVRPQNKNSSQFLHTLLETEDVKNDIRTRAVGQTMPSINTEILKTTPLRLPESTLEQEQLGKYFLNLDTLITLHQRKLEKLQNIKKSCLEKMFV